MDTNDKYRQGRQALLERTNEAKECLKEDVRHIRKGEAARKKVNRVFLTVLTLLTVAVHYLYFSSPGSVVVNRNGELHGLTNKARASLQGRRFWSDQLHEVAREIRWDDSGILRNAADGRTSWKRDRDADREMEMYYRRYPQLRSTLAELRAEAERGRITQTEWMIYSDFLEEIRADRSRELQSILSIVRSKSG